MKSNPVRKTSEQETKGTFLPTAFQSVEFISPVRSEIMCSTYEIIHICTAVVDESKE